MSKLFLPFGFFSSGKSDLPVIGQFTVSNITANSMDLSANLILDGESGPVSAVGFVYSDSVTQPDLNTPNTTIVSASVPGSLPGSFQAQLTGLTDTTGFYIRAFATNLEGTRYTSTKLAETLWDAFTFKFDSRQLRRNQGNLNEIWLGTLTSGTEQINNVTINHGDQYVQIKISQPDNPNFTEVIYNKSYTADRDHKVTIPYFQDDSNGDNTIDLKDNGEIYVSIAPQSNPSGNFTNFRFTDLTGADYSNGPFNAYQQGVTTALASTKVFEWGTTKWTKLVYMFASDNTQADTNDDEKRSPCAIGIDIPDLSECKSIDKLEKMLD